jgi:hypothetical protein
MEISPVTIEAGSSQRKPGEEVTFFPESEIMKTPVYGQIKFFFHSIK